MSDHQMVCKHCGGKRFHAEVRVEAWVDSTGVWVGDDGKPHFEPKGRPEDTYDYEIDSYACSTCERSEWKLDALVVPEPEDEPIAPCGRCDHSRADHPQHGPFPRRQDPYTRPAMPCQHVGCDCHDYYDREVAEGGQPAETLRLIGRAA